MTASMLPTSGTAVATVSGDRGIPTCCSRSTQSKWYAARGGRTCALGWTQGRRRGWWGYVRAGRSVAVPKGQAERRRGASDVLVTVHRFVWKEDEDGEQTRGCGHGAHAGQCEPNENGSVDARRSGRKIVPATVTS